MSGSKSKSFKLGRDAGNGQFIPVDEARRRPASTTVEHIPKRGRGDVDPPKKGK